jgi:uncharacterized membrane protein (DUF485 family)
MYRKAPAWVPEIGITSEEGGPMTQGDSASGADEGRGYEAIDWIAAERSEEFRALVKRRRRFVVPATIFFLGWYSAFVLLSGYAPRFMGTSLYEGLTVGYALALSQFVMVWVLGWLYLRRADRDFDPLARRAAEKAIEVGASGRRGPPAEEGARPAPGATDAPPGGER